MMHVFCDTNILIYAYSTTEPFKADVANRVLFEQHSFVSTQVINEFINTCYRKQRLPDHQVAQAVSEIIQCFQVVSFSVATQIKALNIKERYRLQYYDSLIIATALENDCNVLYSEDMQHGLVIDQRLRIVNPFVSD
jgi:predicted nucleic acid-binding protein